MVNLIIAPSLIVHFTVHSSEIHNPEHNALLSRNNVAPEDYTTIFLEDTPLIVTNSTPIKTLCSHFDDIKEFLESHSEEFCSEKLTQYLETITLLIGNDYCHLSILMQRIESLIR